jgi:hypothetical protein
MKPVKPPKPAALDTTLPVPGALGAVLEACGVRAVLTVTDVSGAPLDPAALQVTRTMLAAWAERERRVDALVTAAAALAPGASHAASTLAAAAAADRPVRRRPRAS